MTPKKRWGFLEDRIRAVTNVSIFGHKCSQNVDKSNNNPTCLRVCKVLIYFCS